MLVIPKIGFEFVHEIGWIHTFEPGRVIDPSSVHATFEIISFIAIRKGDMRSRANHQTGNTSTFSGKERN
jgi:hypothetical protein